MWVQPLGQEDPFEEGMTTHSSILAQKIPWMEEPGGLQSIGCKELDMIEGTEHAQMNMRYCLFLDIQGRIIETDSA